ncbi:hypothetical protein OFL77_27160, partial [Escherichia coli]|uniref:hypothetical protein n=1 Tax=Escherichia coli TaxID=562 RepID=UPI0021E0199E
IEERNVNALKSGVELDNPKTEDEKIVANNVKQSMADLEVLARTRFTPEQIAAFKNDPITFTKAGKFLNAQNTLPAGGVYQAFDLVVAN